jgi:hypothetical protein
VLGAKARWVKVLLNTTEGDDYQTDIFFKFTARIGSMEHVNQHYFNR